MEHLLAFPLLQVLASITLISADASAGTAVLEWYIYNDTCILHSLNTSSVINDSTCPPVYLYLDGCVALLPARVVLPHKTVQESFIVPVGQLVIPVERLVIQYTI